MQPAMRSAALDDRARYELAEEWERHRREIAAIKVNERDRALCEFHQHMDRVEGTMQAQ